MSEADRDDGVNRRKVLECMTWVGTGVLWTVSGGVPHSLGIMGEAAAAEAKGLTFLQISDSHVGFDKPANPNARGTLEEAIAKANAQPQKPAFMIHTGDISHLSLQSQFDDADRIMSAIGRPEVSTSGRSATLIPPNSTSSWRKSTRHSAAARPDWPASPLPGKS
jgi:hypothetical protein